MRRSRAMWIVRALGLFASLLIALWAGFFVAFGLRERLAERPLPAIPREVALRAVEREAREAVALGMTRAEQGDGEITSGEGLWSWSRPVSFRGRECVAVIAATWGHQAPQVLALQGTDQPANRVVHQPEPVSLETLQGALSLQVQWCEHEPGTRNVVLETASIDPLHRARYTAGQVRWAIYRGSWADTGGPRSLRRGRLSREALRALGPEVALDEARALRPAGASPLGAPVELTLRGARLVPASDVTYQALWRASAGDSGLAVNPRVDPTPSLAGPDDPIGRGLGLPLGMREAGESLAGGAALPPVHDPIVSHAPGAFRRVLAVVDRGRLPSRCAALTFTRLHLGTRTEVYRVEPGTWTFTRLGATEHVATDRVCPAEGVALYAVPDSDQERYVLQVWSLADTLPP